MKLHLGNHLFTIAAVALLVSLNVSAETAEDFEGGLFAPPEAADQDEPEMDTAGATVSPGEGIEVVTPEGQHILLKDDHTWDYIQVEQLPPEESAVLTVANVKDLGTTCDIGFTMTNNLPYMIRSLVPRFSAYTKDEVLYDTHSTSFNSIKPTGTQYRKVRFIGISCADISHIKLHGADRCTMGPFTKFDSAEGECLKRIYLEESDLIKVIK